MNTAKTEATVDDLYRVPENGKAEWDVDVLREKLVRVYRASEPTSPSFYRSGELAEAEPALPGWTMSLEELFIED